MALAGLGLAGCETHVSLFGSSCDRLRKTPRILPRPRHRSRRWPRVTVAPIIGAPDAIAKQIQQEFTSAVEKQRVSVTASKDERADYTLRGYIVAAKDKAATKVSYIWDVTDPTGKRVNRITGEEIVSANASKDPWAALTPQVAQSIAGKAANSFVAWLPSQSGQAAMAANAAAQPASVGAQPAARGTAAPSAGQAHAAAAKQPACDACRAAPARRRAASAATAL